MAQQQVVIQPKGIVTNVSQQLSPEGSFEKGDNVVIDSPGIIKSRNGFDLVDITSFYPDSSGEESYDQVIKAIFEIGNTGNYGILSAYNGATSFSSEDLSWARVDGLPLPVNDQTGFNFLKQGQYTYFTTAEGIRKIDNNDNSHIFTVGVTRATGTTQPPAVNTNGSVLWFEDLHVVAYRLVWGYYDYGNVTRLGSPSDRTIVNNFIGTTCSVDLKYNIPEVILNDTNRAYFFRLYRSLQIPYAPPAEPSDELYLCSETTLTGTDISNGYITITDIQPEDYLGETIYCANSQEGILQSNDVPPIAEDITLYKNCVMLSNIYTPKSASFNVIGYIPVGTRITAGGALLTAGLVDNPTQSVFHSAGIHTATWYISGGDTVLSLYQSVNTNLVPHGLVGGNTPEQITVNITNSTDGTNFPNGQYIFESRNNFEMWRNATGSDSQGNCDIEVYPSPAVQPSEIITYNAAAIANAISNSLVSHSVGYSKAAGAGNTVITDATLAALVNNGDYVYIFPQYEGSLNLPYAPTALYYEVKNKSGNHFEITDPYVGSPAGTVTGTCYAGVSKAVENNNLIGYVASTPDIAPGHLTVSQVNYVDTTVPISCNADLFSPNYLYLSDNSQPNVVRFSKQFVYESFPIANSFPVGNSSSKIKRILGLRDACFVMKDDGEIWRIVGETPSEFRALLFDSNTSILGPKTAVVLNNNIYMLTDQGVVELNDTQGTIVSSPIKDQFNEILSLSGQDKEDFETAAFGMGSDPDFRYYLCDGEKFWIYNFMSKAWTTASMKSMMSYPYNQSLVQNCVAEYTEDSRIVTITKTNHGLTTSNRIHVRSSSDTDIVPNYAYDVYAVVDANHFQIEVANPPDSSSSTVNRVTRSAFDPLNLLTGIDRVPPMAYNSGSTTFSVYEYPQILSLLQQYDTVEITKLGLMGPATGTYTIAAVGANCYYIIDPTYLPSIPGYYPIARTFPARITTTVVNVTLNYIVDNKTATITAGTVSNNNNRFFISNGIGLYKERKDLAITDFKDYDVIFPAEGTQVDIPIPVDLKFNPFFGGNPGMAKRFREFTFFVTDNLEDIEFYFQNEFAPSSIPMKVVGSNWGTGNWGGGIWGGKGYTNGSAGRLYFPLELQRAVWMSIGVRTTAIEQALNISGVSIIYEIVDTRFSTDG